MPIICILSLLLRLQIDRISLSQISNEGTPEKYLDESVTTATVQSLDRSSFFNGRGKTSKRNRNSAPFKKHRTRRIQTGNKLSLEYVP